MRYRRARTSGATYFFTLVTQNRQPILCQENNVQLLRKAFRHVRHSWPFDIEAFVLLPEHLHCIWTLPADEANFSTRWNLIKGYFTRHCELRDQTAVSMSKRDKRERGIWQRRFWEHQIRDDEDFTRHVEYIHYNPVKHGLVSRPVDWPHSSFHRYVRNGLYVADWGECDTTPIEGKEFGE